MRRDGGCTVGTGRGGGYRGAAGEVPPSVRLLRGPVPPAEDAGLVERLLDADRDAEPAQRTRSVRGARRFARAWGTAPYAMPEPSAAVREVRPVRGSAGGGADAFGARAGTKTEDQEIFYPKNGSLNFV